MISDNHSAGLILNESRVSGDISKNHDIPSAIHYQNTLITNAKGLKDIFSDEFESIGQEQIILNPLGVIVQNVSSSVFCGVKRNKKCIENRFLIIISSSRYNFLSKITRNDENHH